MHHHLVGGNEATDQQVEDTSERQSHDRAREDDDVVRHAEVRRRQREEQTRRADVDGRAGVVPVQNPDDRGGDVEPAVGVWWVLRVSQNGLFKVVDQCDGRGGGDGQDQLQLRAPLPVDCRSVEDIFDDLGDRDLRLDPVACGDGGLEGVEVRAHEPGKCLEVDEVHGVRVGRISQNDPHAAALLAVADNRPLRVQDRLLQWHLGLKLLLGEGKVKRIGAQQGIAAGKAVRIFSFERSRSNVHLPFMRHPEADSLCPFAVVIGERTGAFETATKNFRQAPGLLGRLFQRVASVPRVIWFGRIADKLVSGDGSRNGVVLEQIVRNIRYI